MHKNPKAIIAIVTAIVVLTIGYKLVFPSGPSREEQQLAIERAVMHDRGLASRLTEEAGFFGLLFGDAEAERNYVARLRQIPLENCPADFAKAYQAHITAWESGNRYAIEATWNQVICIACEYGVKTE